MFLKVGILVLCQFYLSTESPQIQDGEKTKVRPPHQVVGTIKSITTKQKFDTEIKDGEVVASTHDETLLEVVGNEPNLRYYINSNACVRVKSPEEVAQAAEAKKIKAAAEKKKTQDQEKAKKSEVKPEQMSGDKIPDVAPKVEEEAAVPVEQNEEANAPSSKPVKKVNPLNMGLGAIPSQPEEEPTPSPKDEGKDSMVKSIVKDILNQ
jgi:hypothetical protein